MLQQSSWLTTYSSENDRQLHETTRLLLLHRAKLITYIDPAHLTPDQSTQGLCLLTTREATIQATNKIMISISSFLLQIQTPHTYQEFPKCINPATNTLNTQPAHRQQSLYILTHSVASPASYESFPHSLPRECCRQVDGGGSLT